MKLFHGGKKKVKVVDQEKLQKRDAGFYGVGFYTTDNKTHAKTYGKSISCFDVDPNAKVLDGSKVSDKKIQGDYYKTHWKKAKERGKLSTLKQETLEITRKNHLAWSQALDGFGSRHNFDIIKHSPGEIVIKNAKVLKPCKKG